MAGLSLAKVRTRRGEAGVEGDKSEACFARPERRAHAGAWPARFSGRISPTLRRRFCGRREPGKAGRACWGGRGRRAKRQSTALPARSAKRVQTLGRKRGRRIAVPLGPSGEDAPCQINNGDLKRNGMRRVGKGRQPLPTRLIFAININDRACSPIFRYSPLSYPAVKA